MKLENSKTSDAHRLRVHLTDNIDLQRGDNHIALSNISIYNTHVRIQKISTETISSKYQDAELKR